MLDKAFFFFFFLCRRMMLNLARERTIYIPRVFMLSLFVPFICAFLGHMKTNQESIQDRIGLMYQSASVPPYVSILNAVAICKSAPYIWSNLPFCQRCTKNIRAKTLRGEFYAFQRKAWNGDPRSSPILRCLVLSRTFPSRTSRVSYLVHCIDCGSYLETCRQISLYKLLTIKCVIHRFSKHGTRESRTTFLERSIK